MNNIDVYETLTSAGVTVDLTSPGPSLSGRTAASNGH